MQATFGSERGAADAKRDGRHTKNQRRDPRVSRARDFSRCVSVQCEEKAGALSHGPVTRLVCGN